MDKKILIIGSLGTLGQELLKIFPNATSWDRAEIDITDEKQVKQKIAELKPEVVINAAAYNAVDKCETDVEQFELAKKINGYAVGYLADACTKMNAILIHYSTNYVFNGECEGGYNEDSKPNPINKYGQSKLLGEQEILEYKNLKFYIIRLSKLFGKKGVSEMAKDNFFDIIVKLTETQNEIKVVDDELSNFTYAPDLAKFTKNLLDNKHEIGIYHGINETPCTWYEGAKTLFDIIDKHVKLIRVNSDEFSRPAKRPRYAILNNNKLPKLRSYKEALREFIKLIRKN